MAGVVGFEPTDVGVRVQCLTAWRYPTKIQIQPFKTTKIQNNCQQFKLILILKICVPF